MPENRTNTKWLALLALAPPLLLALSNPTIFFKALSFAGGICAMVLFGILPILIIWIGRYRKNISGSHRIPGGKPALVLALLVSFLVIGCELYQTRPWSWNFGRKIFCPAALWRSKQTWESLRDRTKRQGEKDADENSKGMAESGISRFFSF